MEFSLRVPLDDIREWATKYSGEYDSEVEECGARIRAAGFLDKPDFLTLCRWKSHWIPKWADKNSPEYVRLVARTALASENERFRIESLTLLKGVGWPMASVILHFGSTDRYPILDIHALRSLSVDVPNQYSFELWWDYTQCCRSLAERADVPMRTLDRALWIYSKENQRKR